MTTIVIPGLRGLQQSAIVEAFHATGATVLGTSRQPGPGLFSANPETGEGLAAAFHGTDVVAFTLPQDHRPGATLRIATHVARAAAEAGVRRIVLNAAARIERPIIYAPISLPGFAAGLNAAFGAPAGDRITELYGHLAAHPASMQDGAEGMARLGVTPEPFAAFVARSTWAMAA